MIDSGKGTAVDDGLRDIRHDSGHVSPLVRVVYHAGNGPHFGQQVHPLRLSR